MMCSYDRVRRRFIVAAIAFSGVAATSLGTSMLRIARVWAESEKGLDTRTLDAMVRMARMLFPHDAMPDAFYADVLDKALAAAAGDPSLAELLVEAERALDASGPRRWFDLDERDQLEVLREIEGAEFFTAIQGAVRAGVYLHPMFWKHIGYPGSSKEHGGYINRGSDDIDWLPEAPR